MEHNFLFPWIGADSVNCAQSGDIKVGELQGATSSMGFTVGHELSFWFHLNFFTQVFLCESTQSGPSLLQASQSLRTKGGYRICVGHEFPFSSQANCKVHNLACFPIQSGYARWYISQLDETTAGQLTCCSHVFVFESRPIFVQTFSKLRMHCFPNTIQPSQVVGTTAGHTYEYPLNEGKDSIRTIHRMLSKIKNTEMLNELNWKLFLFLSYFIFNFDITYTVLVCSIIEFDQFFLDFFKFNKTLLTFSTQ